MFCHNCGAELPATARFCTACGGDVTLPPVTDPATRAALGLPYQSVRTPSFHGTGGELFGLYVVNALLSVVTLGVYWFWGRAKIRRYVFSHVQFDGERFQFHGTGLEMFKGWLKAIGLLAVVYIGLGAMVVALARGRADATLLQAVLIALTVLFSLFAIPYAIVGTWRYRVSRTSWRGIRFSFTGNGSDFLLIWVRGALFTVGTLGLYLPFFLNDTRGYLMSHTRFGTLPFRYTGAGSEIFPRFLVAACLMLVTLGLYRFWWTAEFDRFVWQHTTLGPMRFKSSYQGSGLFGLAILNNIMLVFTLGLAYPWTVVRTLAYRLDNLWMEGELDYAAILQQMQDASATGEGLADMLDLDADLGF